MSDIKPELSKKSKYYLDRNRFYELKYFCRQYPTWQKLMKNIDSTVSSQIKVDYYTTSTSSDPTIFAAETREFYKNRIDLLRTIALTADPALGPYILAGVTRGLSYDKLNQIEPIPASRELYYEMYRKFFWLLSRTLN